MSKSKYSYGVEDLPARPGAKTRVKTREEKLGKMQRRTGKRVASGRATGQTHLGDNRFEERKQKYTPMIIRGINRRVKQGFKSWCHMHGTNMTAALEDYMRRCANEVLPTDEKVVRKDTKRGRPMDGNGRYNRHFTPSAPKDIRINKQDKSDE